MRTSALFGAKTSDFLCGHFSETERGDQYVTILCGRPLWTAPYCYLTLQEEYSSPAWSNIQLDYPNSLHQFGFRQKECDLWDDIGYATP